MEEDPFSCFDDDNDSADDCAQDATNDDAEQPSISAVANKSATTVRDDDCGILAFHAGTEQALLQHVTTQVAANHPSAAAKPKFVLDSIDEFCAHRHWMMHVGAEKGTILQRFLMQSRKHRQSTKPAATATFTVVELGTYCGYAAIMMAATLEEPNDGPAYKIFSVEAVEQHARVARSMIELAGLQDKIQVLLLDLAVGSMTVSQLLRGAMEDDGKDCKDGSASRADFVFIDHDKSLYLPDLRELEANRLIGKATHVAADNVIFAGIDDYRDYVKTLANDGVVETTLETSYVEYSQAERQSNSVQTDVLRDGIELTVYLKDPPLK